MEKREKAGQAASAEAENMETMELLTGMLDNATRCGATGEEHKEAPENSREHHPDGADCHPAHDKR